MEAPFQCSVFFNLAEETGLIIPIGEWVVKTVCEQINAWQARGYRIPKVAINLSARQFRDKELINNIARILDETGVAAHHITLEITESMLIDNIEKVVETLNCLNAMGIRISIDDFGTGYSSLSYLKRFPIHTLKIDRTFVRDIVTDRSDHTIVATIIAMAHSLEMDVIAEGIETENNSIFCVLSIAITIKAIISASQSPPLKSNTCSLNPHHTIERFTPSVRPVNSLLKFHTFPPRRQ